MFYDTMQLGSYWQMMAFLLYSIQPILATYMYTINVLNKDSCQDTVNKSNKSISK